MTNVTRSGLVVIWLYKFPQSCLQLTVLQNKLVVWKLAIVTISCAVFTAVALGPTRLDQNALCSAEEGLWNRECNFIFIGGFVNQKTKVLQGIHY